MNNESQTTIIDAMFKAGAHFGFGRSRRHPSMSPFIFGMKNRVEIFDLEKTKDLLIRAKEIVRGFGKNGSQILFVGGKSEARQAIRDAADKLRMPYVTGRWLGGTLTNFKEIRRRIDRLQDLLAERQSGGLVKYTKRERMIIDREIAHLERFFSGLSLMKEKPNALFVIDPRHEHTAVSEAKKERIPLITLASSDCQFGDANYPIVGNDSSRQSIEFFIKEIVAAYEQGQTEKLKT
jgi:small subunit ribosomal protein S2